MTRKKTATKPPTKKTTVQGKSPIQRQAETSDDNPTFNRASKLFWQSMALMAESGVSLRVILRAGKRRVVMENGQIIEDATVSKKTV